MKHCIIILLLGISLSACNKTGKALKEKVSGADSVAINYFKGDGTMDSVVAVKIVRDAKLIEAITEMSGSRASKNVNTCGADGSMHFFKMNKVIQDIDFRLGDDCSQLAYSFMGAWYTAALHNDAKQLLLGLKTGNK